MEIELLDYMGEISEILEPDRESLPDCTTIYKSFDRFKMWV